MLYAGFLCFSIKPNRHLGQHQTSQEPVHTHTSAASSVHLDLLCSPTMARVQRAVGFLRALGGSLAAVSHNPSQLAAVQQLARCYSQALEPVAPAVTNADIASEWYLRQRSQISLGNRHPHAAVSVYIAPSAVVVGDVDLTDRVSTVTVGAAVLGAVLQGCHRGYLIHNQLQLPLTSMSNAQQCLSGEAPRSRCLMLLAAQGTLYQTRSWS